MINEHVVLLKISWQKKQKEICKKISEFNTVNKTYSPQDIYCEFAFCLLTPQSKAKSCWAAIEKLKGSGLLFNGTQSKIADVLGKTGVRFKNNKAGYLIKTRDFIKGPGLAAKIASFKTETEARKWLVDNVKGMGYKEASHFLRNIGLGRTIAILDRHILKNLKLLGVIKDIPKTITPKTYLEIEKKMRFFSKTVKIPLSHLDLLFWSKETGEIFK